MDIANLLAQLGPAGKQDGQSRQQRLYVLLRRAILDGTLAGGSKLPATRQVAAATGIARNSVIFAYEQLAAEGFLVTDRRATRVAHQAALSRPAPADPPASAAAPLSKRSQQSPAPRQDTYHLPFAPGVPDLNLFPRQRWAKYLQRAWQEIGARHLAYTASGGEPRLREAIASLLRLRRGLNCQAAQVIVTAGTLMAVEACARLLADANDVAWMESPGYPPVRSALQDAGLTVVDIPVDGDGMRTDPRHWQQQPPRLIFVSPSHQYPLGAVMSLPRRLDLLQAARTQRTWLIEDDYDSELSYAGKQSSSLQGLDPEAPVIYVGTFSKSLFPGLRIGYMVVPAWASTALGERFQQRYRTGQAAEQLALASFIESGDLARHLRHMRAIYQARQTYLRTQLQIHFGDEISILGGAAGIHLTIVFKRAIDDQALAEQAAALGVSSRPLSRFYGSGHTAERSSGLVLGYGVADEKQIKNLVPRLRQAYLATLKPNTPTASV